MGKLAGPWIVFSDVGRMAGWGRWGAFSRRGFFDEVGVVPGRNFAFMRNAVGD